jgi:ABC-type Fe3+ transport system permease subunit
MNRNYGGLSSKSSAGTAFMLAVMVVPTAIISHILIDGNFSNLIEEATTIGLVVPLLVMALSFTGAKYAIEYLPVKVITSLFILIISISMFKYIQEILAIIF